MWLVKRLAVSVFLILAVASIVFLALRFVPGDPAELLLTQGSSAPDQAMVEELRAKLGLNKPILVQYVEAFRGILTGDLGHSLQDNSPVADEVLKRLPRTLELILAAGLIAIAVGLPIGIMASLRPGGAFDRLSSFVAACLLASPVFVIGALMLLVVSQILRAVPAGGFVPFTQDPVQHLILLLMPAGAIAISLWAIVFRITRTSILDVMTRAFVRTAKAKGLGPVRVLSGHVLRNALIPIVTVVALQLGTLFGGTVLVEFVFNWPGMSLLLVEAVNQRDYPMVQGIVLVVSILFVGLNLAVDLIYGWLDPRVRRA
jgi:peptide/nickel transport system permease protein